MKYEKYLASLAFKKITPEEIIMKKFFYHRGQKIAIVRNEFPLKLRKSKHWVLWTIKPLSLENGLFILKQYFEESSILAIWENHLNKRSVKGIEHFHFVIQA